MRFVIMALTFIIVLQLDRVNDELKTIHHLLDTQLSVLAKGVAK